MKRFSLLDPSQIPPSQENMEVVGTFNPGAVKVDGTIYLLVRVAERPTLQEKGWLWFPRAVGGSDYAVDLERKKANDFIYQDNRSYKSRQEGWLCPTTISHLRLVKVSMEPDGEPKLEISTKPTFFPVEEYEKFGVEDARITPIDGMYYITYVAVSEHGVSTALARTKDFEHFERLGVIFPVENKDVVIFPRAGGEYWALHRPLAAHPFGPIEMWLAKSPDLVHWGSNRTLSNEALGVSNKQLRIGAGTPPIQFAEGWLEIYHAAVKVKDEDHIGRYYGAAVVMDKQEPYKIRRVSRWPLLEPIESFEREGFVPDVVFPTGIVEMGDKFMIFYGAADERVGVAILSREEIENSMERFPAD